MIDTLTRRFTTPGGAELAWDQWGEGDVALVLAHGFSGSAHDFALQVELLAEQGRVVTLDHRGHGLSSKPDGPDAYELDLLTADLVALIETQVGAPVDLLGHSMGGRIATQLALGRPDLLRSLILMDTTANAFAPEDDELRELIAAFFESATVDQMAEVSAPGPETALIEASTTEAWRDLKAARNADFSPIAARGLGRQIFGGDFELLGDRLPEIDVPVTVIVGSEDHPFVDHAPELADSVANGQLVVIEGAYHSPQLTHADDWRAAVLGHLNRV